jgi:GH43 family beta-xylosidase
MLKSRVALLTAFAVAFSTLLVAPPAPAVAATIDDGLVAWYRLDETAGTSVADSSGNGRTAAVEGTAAWNAGHGFVFGGGGASSGNAVRLPDDLTAGLDSITVSFDTWVDPSLTGNHFIYNLGNEAVGTPQSGTGYLFATSTPYRSAISPAAWGGEKVTSKGSNLAKATWKRLTYTQTGTVGTLYENGTQVAQNTAVTVTPAQIGAGTTTRNYIGRSAYAADNSFKGVVSDFRIYDRALTTGEVGELATRSATALAASDAAWVETALGDVSAVAGNITLPATGPAKSSITWASSNPAVVSATGTVNRTTSPETVDLTATVTAGDVTQTRTIPVTVLATASPDGDAAQLALDALVLHGLDDVRGNLTLPASSVPGVTVAWSSSDADVIATDGVVSRPAHGDDAASVTLTATATKGDATVTRTFAAAVPALPAKQEYESYLFSYFTGDSVAGEKIYFGASTGNDARNWLALNGGKPVIASTQSTTGLRDPFIVRSPEGDKFYMIATDLSIGGGTSWDASQRTGSKYIEVWESTDLVNWSEQRHVQVSPDTAGNTWAPEAFYDEELGAYVVFWASKIYAETDPNHTGSAPNVMMYATTRDFQTFTEAKVWQNTGVSRIDSTVIKEGDTYHRFTKDEAQSMGCLDVFEETSTDLLAVTTKTSATGQWALQESCIGKNAGTGAVEGPTIVKANPGDVNGEGYYLFVDEFSGRKYIPLFSKTLGVDADWTIPADYTLPNPAPRHGTVLPITAEEQERVFAALLPAVTEVKPVSLTTPVGTEATLPKTAAVLFADGSQQELAVTWDATPAGYEKTAQTITVTGEVSGIDRRVTATIKVAAAQGDLRLHYDFSKATATTVPDSSPYGNDGVIKGTGATVNGAELTLPGGSNSSTGAYVQLPTGLFDGRNTLTISTWLRNDRASGNYAAMFFGSASNPPAQYWLLNPKNPSGLFKSVITNGNSPSAPWGTEAGISATNAGSSIAGPATSNAWGLYTTVIEPNQITGYFNGKKVGTVPTTRTVSQFGSNLVSYIGKSSYPDDLYKGGVCDVKVWTTALDDASISAEYYAWADEATVQAALEADAAALNPGSGVITTDRELATSGGNGSSITWASDRPDVIAADGTVTRPTVEDAPVTLTATLTLAGRTITREFPFTVLADTPQNNLAVAVDGYDLAITRITDDIVLRTSVGDVAVSWATSDAATIATDGSVTRPAAEKPVTLTATFSLDSLTATREFAVSVLAADAGRIGSYISTGDTTRTDVLHLAASSSPEADGATYAGLNKGRGILYPTLGAAKFGPPVLLRAPDGTFRLVAIENGQGSRLYVYDSADLTSFTNERLVSFVPGIVSATAVSASYDNGIGRYRVGYTAQGGARFEVTTADFVTFSAPSAATAATPAAPDASGNFPAAASGASSIGVTAAEYARIGETYGRVVNTGVQSFADVAIDEGGTPVLPETATVEYSSGDTSSMPVEWDADDVAALKTAAPGSYLVDGTVTRPTFPDPLVERRADPDVTLGDDGRYYFTGSYPMTRADDPNGYDRIVLRSADTIQGLGTAPEATIWHENTDPGLNRYIWAPELEKIGDDWYILFTAGRTSGFDIRPAMLKFTGDEFGGDAALDPANWTSLGYVKAAPGDASAFTSFSLDMTHFEEAGKHYVIWAEKPAIGSTLRMAEIDPANPNQLTSQSILLSAPTLAWEKNNGDSIDEGPAVIKKDGKIVIAFSAATVDDKYCVGVLTADAAADLTDPSSWTKNPYPLLTTDDVPGQVGPGHNSFTVDEFGNPVIVYHSRTVNDSSNPGEATDAGLFDPRRHARAALVHWTSTGLPVFAMTAEEELAPSNAAVQVRVVVGGDVDPEAPTVVVTTTPGAPDGAAGWFRTAPTVTLAAGSDAPADLQYRIDGGEWTAYTAPIAVTGDGARTVEYRASVGGVPVESSVGSVALNVDLAAPSVSAVSAPASAVGTIDEPVVVTLSASDETSGVERIEYRVDAGKWAVYGEPLSFGEVGSSLLEYRAIDVAGNVSATAPLSVVVSGPDTPDASITLSASSVVAGEPITVTGRGFGADDRIDLVLFSDPVFLGSIDADGEGRFTATLRIPLATPAGEHTVRAAGSESGALAEAALTVQAAPPVPGVPVAPVAPGAGAPGGGLLSQTGSGALFIGLGALALLLAGGAVILLRRRRV